MAKNDNLTDFLTDVADGIRTAEGTTAAVNPQDFRNRIEGIVTTVTSDADATADNILNGKTAYVNGAKVTGNITTKTSSDLTVSSNTVTVPAGYYAVSASKSVATVTQATPSISINSSGLITASASQSAGYVSSGTKSATKQLTTQAAQTITPGTSNQTAVASGRYTTGAVTVKGDANLVAGNIKKGTSIFGVTGTMEEATDPNLQTKTVTPSTSAQEVTPDTGYDGLSKVTVNAMPTATQATPSITVSASGLITASATQSAGYVSSGTKSATKQLTTKAAATITPGTSDQTIASGTYLTGVQTIKGDSNLVADNIKSGTSIFGVTGTYEGSSGGDGAFVCLPTQTTDGGYNFENLTLVMCNFHYGEFSFLGCYNVTVDNCVFLDCTVHCNQDFYDAIVNGPNNTYTNVYFDIS